jgi:hypothetical protein
MRCYPTSTGAARSPGGSVTLSATSFSDQGGIERVAETRLQLIRRVAANCVLAEAMEAKMAQGMVIDTDTHCALSGVAVRIAARLALNRRPRVMAAALAAAEKSPGR